MTSNYDIFISYRREGGYDTAKHLNDLLVRDGYRVSFDIDTLRSGDFDTQLLERIDQCKDFILIVDSHAFDRTLDPKFDPKNDWMRCELAYALKKNKNIVPVFLSGVTGFPVNLPKDVVGVTKKNGPEYNRYYFNDFYKTLKKRFLHKKTSSHIKLYIVLSILLLTVIASMFLLRGKGSEDEHMGLNQMIENNTVKEMATDTSTNKENPMKKFCGSFSHSDHAANIGGLNYVYELVLDPVNSTCTLVEDGIVNITNSKGYCGTMMQMPDYWEVISFSLNSNGKVAIAEMIGGDNSLCKVSLTLDEYDNLVMSYISGNEAPGVLWGDDGKYSRAVTFTR